VDGTAKGSEVTIRQIPAWFFLCLMLVGSFARADKAPKPASVVGRIVGLEVYGDQCIVTVAAGTEQGIAKDWRAKFREGKTEKPLANGDAILIRVNKRTTILKTNLTPDQVRANKYIQLDPPS
jgi:hypothetical protein